MKTTGRIVNNEFVPDSETEYRIILQKYESQYVEIEISASVKRSTRQNKFYWGCIIPVILEGFREYGIRGEILRGYPVALSEVGMLSYEDELTKKAVDKYLLCKFHTYTEGMSIRSMNPQQFGGYILEIITWAKDVLQVKFGELTTPEDSDIFKFSTE